MALVGTVGSEPLEGGVSLSTSFPLVPSESSLCLLHSKQTWRLYLALASIPCDNKYRPEPPALAFCVLTLLDNVWLWLWGPAGFQDCVKGSRGPKVTPDTLTVSLLWDLGPPARVRCASSSHWVLQKAVTTPEKVHFPFPVDWVSSRQASSLTSQSPFPPAPYPTPT